MSVLSLQAKSQMSSAMVYSGVLASLVVTKTSTPSVSLRITAHYYRIPTKPMKMVMESVTSVIIALRSQT
jgi:hypothetical protein